MFCSISIGGVCRMISRKVETHTFTNGACEEFNLYFSRGVGSRRCGPAETFYDNDDGLINYKVWKLKGHWHRLFCYAYISYNVDGTERLKECWNFDLFVKKISYYTYDGRNLFCVKNREHILN